MQVTVDETFDADHRVVTQTTTSSQTMSKFTFSAADSGLHRLCFTPSGPAAVSVGGWFGGGAAGSTIGGVKLTVDMAIGETSKIESEDKGKIDSIVGKVKELNGRLSDIRREQVFQRVSPFLLRNPVSSYLPSDTPPHRNEKPNSVTRAKPSIRGSCAGR